MGYNGHDAWPHVGHRACEEAGEYRTQPGRANADSPSRENRVVEYFGRDDAEDQVPQESDLVVIQPKEPEDELAGLVDREAEQCHDRKVVHEHLPSHPWTL